MNLIALNTRKNIPQGENIVTDLIKAFLGCGSVNRLERTTLEAVSQWTNVIARC
jgi:hypothetical protein